MQVSVEASGIIERKLTVSIPAENIQSAVAKRLNEMVKNVRIPGFRPGKAPHHLITKRYSAQVTSEVINETIHSSYQDALTQEGIVPAGLLSIEPTLYEANEALTYIATIELFPKIPEPNLAGKTIEKPIAEVTDEDVVNVLEYIQKCSAAFTTKTGKSVLGDRLIIDFERKVDGKLFSKKVADFSLILGVGAVPLQLEDELVGLTQGESKTIDYVFPENYYNPEIAGKNVEFTILVKAVEAPEMPILDDDFSESVGMEKNSIEELKQKTRVRLQRILEERVHTVLLNRVVDALYKASDIEIPKSLVEEEIDRLIKADTEEMADDGLPADRIDRENYIDEAKGKIASALIVMAIVEHFNIKIDHEAVRAKAMEMSAYSEKDEGYAEWSSANIEELKYIETMNIEEQVVTHMLETATVKQQIVSFTKFMSNN